MSGVDRLIAYRTMRAVQQQAEMAREQTRPAGGPTVKPTRWQRWQAFVYRWSDRLIG